MAAQVKVQVRQVDASASRAAIRDHAVSIDRPEAKGGGNAGPMGGELLLAGLGGCFMSNLLAAVQARAVEATDLAVEVTGTLAEAPARFESVSLRVSGECADRAELRRLVEIAERGCIVANTLRGSVRLSTEVV